MALLVLFAILVSINPRLRERTEQAVSNPQWESASGTITLAITSGMAVVHGYAGENTYLFTFLIAAVVFTVLMLKVIA